MTAPIIRHRTFCTDPVVRSTAVPFDRLRVRWYCLSCRAEATVIGDAATTWCAVCELSTEHRPDPVSAYSLRCTLCGTVRTEQAAR